MYILKIIDFDINLNTLKMCRINVNAKIPFRWSSKPKYLEVHVIYQKEWSLNEQTGGLKFRRIVARANASQNSTGWTTV